MNKKEFAAIGIVVLLLLLLSFKIDNFVNSSVQSNRDFALDIFFNAITNLFLNESHLDWTEKWFKKKGEKTILISRFVPVVRHLISIPAGIARMNLPKFIFFTAIGATVWNFILLYAGFSLGSHWELIHKYSGPLDILFLIGLGAAAGYFIWKNYKKSSAKK